MSLLDKVSVGLVRDPQLDPKRKMWSDVHLAFISGYPSDETEKAVEAQGEVRRRMLEGRLEFRAALKRITSAGVKAEWDSTSEYSYAASVLRLVVPRKILPRLEEMAAEDAGIHEPDERRQAALLYGRWLLQHHHPEYERYRDEWPVVEESPYRRPSGENPRGDRSAE